MWHWNYVRDCTLLILLVLFCLLLFLLCFFFWFIWFLLFCSSSAFTSSIPFGTLFSVSYWGLEDLPHIHDGLCRNRGHSAIPHPSWFPFLILLNFQGLWIYYCLIWKVPLGMILHANSPCNEDIFAFLELAWTHYHCLTVALKGAVPLEILHNTWSISSGRVKLSNGTENIFWKHQ